MDGKAEDALQQIKTQAYYQKYQLKDKPTALIGANFDSQKRGISEWLVEVLKD